MEALKTMAADARNLARIVAEYDLDSETIYQMRDVMADALKDAKPSMPELEKLVTEIGGDVNGFRQYLNDRLSEIDPDSADEDDYWWVVSLAILIA